MFQKVGSLVALLAIVVIGGCALHDGRPRVAVLEAPDQYKLKSAGQWQVIASDVASKIEETLRQRSLSQEHFGVVASTPNNATFAHVFSSQLQSSLAERGLQVVVGGRPNSYEVAINVDNVRHSESVHRYRPGTLTALSGGVMVLRDMLTHTFDPIGPTLLAGGLFDAISTWEEHDKRPTTEIVLTTTIKKDNLYAVYRTDVYYVDESDVDLFRGPPPPRTPPPDRSRLIGVVGSR